MTMDEIEREAVRAALAEVGGNRRKAAERLGIGERTLYRKIRKYGLDPK
jgi:DNA-binding NtrC family response regulator